MTERFEKVGWTPIVLGDFAVVAGSGLSLISDAHARALTGGVVEPPAAVLMADVITADGQRSMQLLMRANSLGALSGCIKAWADRLPVAARDQFDAVAAEAEQKWTAGVNEHLGEAS